MAQPTPAGLHITEFVRRPGLGRAGKPIRVRANFFEVLSLPDANIHHYDVTITPDVPPVLNRKIYGQFEDMNRTSSLGGERPVYDGRKNIFSPKALPFGDFLTFDITLPEDDGVTTAKRPPRSFKIKIKKVGVIYMEELHRFLQGKNKLTSNCQTAIMALDVLIRHRPSMQYVTVGRSFYTSEGSMPLFGGAEVWQGYYQSARPAQGRMMINLDLSATAFYEGGPLVTIVVKLLGRRSPDDLRRGISDRDRLKLEKSLKNLKIKVVHRGEATSKRRFKITGITPTPASSSIFESAETGETDVASYFFKTYSKRLQYPYLPCVVVRKETFLPMEVCEVIVGQRHMRKLNEKQTADMIKFTCQAPHVRANKIKQGLDVLNYRGNEYLQNFGMRVSNEMAVVDARVLPTPTLQYHPTSRDASFQPRDGAWNLRDKKVATGATLGSWAVIAFGQERDFPKQAVQSFVRELVITCQDTGMNIPNKTPPIMHANPQGDIEGALKQAWLRAGNTAKAQPQLILCILPTTGVPLYAEIKRVGDTVIGVATQCCQSKHMFAAKKQYCANVCLKMNVKLGGMNSFLSPAQVPFITDRPTILMGADVTHPSPNDRNDRPSIASLCGSMDAKASRYSATIRVQTGRTEIIAELANMVKELLKTFYQTCGRKPERILFYRDGVSEGQFTQVLEGEIQAVRAACLALDQSYRPTITFVVVQKRHHARFFPMDKQNSDRSGNCLPGTVVETSITHPFEFDFYLQSHAGLQGTSRPCHYHVLYDENSFTADTLQTLSYNLCYLYARCTRAVSLVPPVYYAHLVCSRARFHARENWSDTESSEEGAGGASSFGTVKAELQKATVGCSIAVIKKSFKSFGSVNSKKDVKIDVASRKKRKDGVLKDGATSELVLFEKAVSSSWRSEASNTIESDSINIKEKCLIKKTSVNYSKKSLFIEGDSNQILKSSRLVTKKVLSMPLEKINFLDNVDNNDILLNTPMIFLSFLKNLVNISVRKSFAIDIELDKVAGKSSQKKLIVVRNLFSKINGFGGVSIPSKFSEIIYAFFISESSLAIVIKKIPVRTLTEALTKRNTGHQAKKKIDETVGIILQRTSINKHHPKVAELENIGANHLGFAKSLFQHYCQHLELNHNHISTESAFNFYVNEKIFSLLGTPVNTESARETFYRELIQNTNLPTNHNFAFIITKINKEIEHYIQQRYPITYASKSKGKLQIPAVTPKKIQPPTWKKTKVELPTALSYHHTPGSAINITSASMFTSNVISTFGQFPFQNKQRKTDLLGPYGKYFEGFKSQSPTPSGI
ncbi:hypothetical protein G9A89_010995 [Geosiphon pyriformis]|nr:hypothetical protein G9A89_010995 [Geosiphon pyriformis]